VEYYPEVIFQTSKYFKGLSCLRFRLRYYYSGFGGCESSKLNKFLVPSVPVDSLVLPFYCLCSITHRFWWLLDHKK